MHQEVLKVIVDCLEEINGVSIDMNEDANRVYLFGVHVALTSLDFITLLIRLENNFDIVFSEGVLIPKEDLSLGELLNDVLTKIDERGKHYESNAEN